MTKNEQVYVMCCQQEVDDDVTSGRNVETVEGYVGEILKLLASIVFEKIEVSHLCNS